MLEDALARGVRRLDELINDRIRRDNINEWGKAAYCAGLDSAVRALGLKTVGGVEWGPWVAHHLVETQDDDGCWNEQQVGGFYATFTTCDALLVLKRVNLFSDLPAEVRAMAALKN